MARFLNEANNGVICKYWQHLCIGPNGGGIPWLNTAPFLWSQHFSLRQGQPCAKFKWENWSLRGIPGVTWIQLTVGSAWVIQGHGLFSWIHSKILLGGGSRWLPSTCSPSAHTMSNTFSSECNTVKRTRENGTKILRDVKPCQMQKEKLTKKTRRNISAALK